MTWYAALGYATYWEALIFWSFVYPWLQKRLYKRGYLSAARSMQITIKYAREWNTTDAESLKDIERRLAEMNELDSPFKWYFL